MLSVPRLRNRKPKVIQKGMPYRGITAKKGTRSCTVFPFYILAARLCYGKNEKTAKRRFFAVGGSYLLQYFLSSVR